jgi:hypothetical protein
MPIRSFNWKPGSLLPADDGATVGGASIGREGRRVAAFVFQG